MPTAGQVDYTLTCEVDVGEGTPTLKWMSPGETNGTVTIGNQTQSGTIFTLNLTFSSLLTSHGGEYTCRSTVQEETRTAKTTLNVQSKQPCMGRTMQC